jgi:hypothetical protein
MQTYLDKLKQSPMFNASLASKELFHSNFIAWFFETFKSETVKFFQDIFPELSINELCKVKREEKNIDLSLVFNDGIKIYVENKVKSLPDYNQLEDYLKKIEKEENSKLILLSLLPEEYKPSIPYSVLINWMNKVVDAHWQEDKITPQNYYIIKDYTGFVEELILLAVETLNNNETFNFDSSTKLYRTFHEVRLHDMLHKIKFDFVRKQVAEKVTSWLSSQLNVPQDKHLHLFHAFNYFSRGTGAVCFHIPINGDKQQQKYFEIQLQDNMLKCMLFANKCYHYQEQITKVDLFQQFFSLVEDESPLFEKAKMRHEFCKYGDYIIYKYAKVKTGCDLIFLINTIVSKITQTIINVHNRQQAIDQFLEDPKNDCKSELLWKFEI